MEKNKDVIFKIEIEYTVVSGAQLPYAITEVLCDIFRQVGAIVLQKLDVED